MSGNIKTVLEELSSLDTEVKASLYICTQCEFVGKYYQALRNHKEKVHGVVYRQFPCDNCSYKARSEQRLSEHILLCENAWKAHEEENKAFRRSKKSLKSCKECDFSTRFQSKMKAHKLAEHTELTKCKFCPFETRFKHALKRHKVTEHQNKYNCQKCDFKTTSKVHISSHIQQNHLPQIPQNVFFVCDKCGKSFKTEQNLVNHRFMIHKDTEIVPSMIPCDNCDLFLESDELLKIHRQRVHEGKGTKLKSCQYCNVPMSMRGVAAHERSCIHKDKQMRDYQGSKLFQDISFGWI